MFLALSLIVLMAANPGHLYCQSGSLYINYDILVDRLNTALQQLSPTTLSQDIYVGDRDILIEGFDGCQRIWSESVNPELYPNGLKLRYNNDGTFTLQLRDAPPRDRALTYNSHILPCYLNGMMFHNRGKHFYDNLGGYEFWEDPAAGEYHPPSTNTPVTTQKYYMGTTGITPGMEATVLPALQDDSYLNTIFDMVDGPIAGTAVKGEDLFRVVRPNMSFIAHYMEAVPGVSLDSNFARPIEWELQFRDQTGDPTWDETLPVALAGIKFVVRTQEYSNDMSFGPPGSIRPDTAAAWYALEVTVATKNGSGWDFDTYPLACQRRYDSKAGSTRTDADVDINNADLWKDFYVLNEEPGPYNRWCRFNLTHNGWLTFEIHDDASECSYEDTLKIVKLMDPKTSEQYCESVFPTGGTFCLDRMNGQLYYSTGVTCETGERQEVTCLPLCPSVLGYQTMDNVIAASVQTYDDEWSYDPNHYGYPPNHSSVYQSGEQGKWRPQSNYGYRTSILSSDSEFGSNSRVYSNGGVFINDSGTTTNAFRLYNFKSDYANNGTKWVKGSTITHFSPSGEPVEELDILGVYSAVRFAHKQMLPELVAKNARYESVDFESFEDGKGNTSETAHSGYYSYLFGGEEPFPKLGPFTVTEQVKNQGMQIQFWVKKTYQNEASHPAVPISVSFSTFTTTATLDSVAQTGEWTLYRLNTGNLSSSTINSTFTISFANELGTSDQLWIDDIRVQPLDAQMICYAYDPFWLRLAATFDDQHFGQFYQYDGEGKLIRTIKETERGMKTVAETHYHTPLADRNASVSAFKAEYGGGMNGAMLASGLGAESASGGGPGEGMKANADVLEFELSPDGPKTKIFGQDPSQLPTMDDLEAAGSLMPDLDLSWLGDTTFLGTDRLEEISIPGVDEAEKVRLLKEIKHIDEEMKRLAQMREKAESSVKKESLEKEVRVLYDKKMRLIREKLGLTEEKLRELEGQLQNEEK